MKKVSVVISVLLMLIFAFSFVSKKQSPAFQFHENLSEYHFFTGNISDLLPANGIIPYNLNTALFSNYAEKARFIKLPAGKKIMYNDSAEFEMPLGTVLIKNFYYFNDIRKPQLGKRIIETRLLANMEDGWHTYQYIWNKEQTDAVFEPIGDITTVEYIDGSGKKMKTNYVVPSQPQCKGCHNQNDTIMPIGIAARHLNGDYAYTTGTQNQLHYWQQHGIIELPSTTIPANASWNNTAATIEQRARAYLDINCGHCHNKAGSANTSGLFLDIHETDSTALGIFKTPVAAGRGSGNLSYDIEPGKPGKSILIYRMNTTDPGFAMPEIGREQIHKEGIALISKWIKEMKH